MAAARDELTISDLAAVTGVPAATLRSWEERYDFPRPRRLGGGHRRYDRRDAAVIQDALRLRDAGQTLPTAIRAALARRDQPEPSLFAGLRRRHPDLRPQRVRKATMLALSRALEDECCARAERPLLFASFQHGRFFEQSRPRWEELARTAAAAVVFADFETPPAVGLVRPIAVAADSPLRREWSVVCDAPDHPGCLVGWEVPGDGRGPDAERAFEVLWSVEPRVVRDAALLCAQLAGPDGGVLELPGGLPPETSADLRRAQGVLDRSLGYLDRCG